METAQHSVVDPQRSTVSAELQAKMRGVYAPVQNALGEVEVLLGQQLQSRHRELQPLLEHGALLGGKRLRPALVLLSAAATGPLKPEHQVIAAVVEMIHTATLIHDDVLDNATERRHLPTINARWSSGASILLGDYLFAQSYALAASVSSTEVCRLVGEAARRVCEGELCQYLQAGDFTLDEGAYFQLIRGKTAELLEVSCRLGARFSGAGDDVVSTMANYGDALGIAFQIADDYLDIWGDSSKVGKTLGSDLEQGKATLPLIRLLETASPKVRALVWKGLELDPVDRFDAILPLLNDSDAKEYTMDVARRFARKAEDALVGLLPSAARQSLRALAALAVDRNA